MIKHHASSVSNILIRTHYALLEGNNRSHRPSVSRVTRGIGGADGGSIAPGRCRRRNATFSHREYFMTIRPQKWVWLFGTIGWVSHSILWKKGHLVNWGWFLQAYLRASVTVSHVMSHDRRIKQFSTRELRKDNSTLLISTALLTGLLVWKPVHWTCRLSNVWIGFSK